MEFASRFSLGSGARYVHPSANEMGSEEGGYRPGKRPDRPLGYWAGPIPSWQIKERIRNEKFHPSRGRPGPFEREIAHERRHPTLSAL